MTKSELKLSRSQTDPVFAVHAVVIPGDHSQNIETIADKVLQNFDSFVKFCFTLQYK